MVRTCVSPLNPDCSERRLGPVNLGLRGERDFALRFRFQLFEKIRIVELVPFDEALRQPFAAVFADHVLAGLGEALEPLSV